MKSYSGIGGIPPLTFGLSTRWRSVASFTPWPLYPRSSNICHIEKCFK